MRPADTSRSPGWHVGYVGYAGDMAVLPRIPWTASIKRQPAGLGRRGRREAEVAEGERSATHTACAPSQVGPIVPLRPVVFEEGAL
jgi:hypothetical protein